ncbi:hypothetical protein ACFQVD_34090 [Streptosporangium amethystogenes subsp. fukuiense]|uniref:ArsR family transcriptional regulator n=1 Tax=Streptosporangium amethystogenes subsp. fukuiense TaxID=698418 RepID=A0ABW2T8Z5_9ACTN
MIVITPAATGAHLFGHRLPPAPGAYRVGISPATASQHTAVLRNAGLLTTGRMGGAVLHTPPPPGSALLSGDSTTA